MDSKKHIFLNIYTQNLVLIIMLPRHSSTTTACEEAALAWCQIFLMLLCLF